jgi:hypothetical protein
VTIPSQKLLGQILAKVSQAYVYPFSAKQPLGAFRVRSGLRRWSTSAVGGIVRLRPALVSLPDNLNDHNRQTVSRL